MKSAIRAAPAKKDESCENSHIVSSTIKIQGAYSLFNGEAAGFRIYDKENLTGRNYRLQYGAPGRGQDFEEFGGSSGPSEMGNERSRKGVCRTPVRRLGISACRAGLVSGKSTELRNPRD